MNWNLLKLLELYNWLIWLLIGIIEAADDFFFVWKEKLRNVIWMDILAKFFWLIKFWIWSLNPKILAKIFWVKLTVYNILKATKKTLKKFPKIFWQIENAQKILSKLIRTESLGQKNLTKITIQITQKKFLEDFGISFSKNLEILSKWRHFSKRVGGEGSKPFPPPSPLAMPLT